MGDRRCCCGCPECDEATATCCKCTCHSLCVYFTPNDYDEETGECPIQSVEVDFNHAINGYSGSLAGYDFYYYFETDEEGVCWFKLQSDALGYPQGSEARWRVASDAVPSTGTGTGNEVTCTNLGTCISAPVLYTTGTDDIACTGGEFCTECVRWITPTGCDTCLCLCECICVTLTISTYIGSNLDELESTETCWGKICWDEVEQAYTGELTCENSSDTGTGTTTRNVSFPIKAIGDTCSDGTGTPVCYTGTGTACDPCDTSCAIGFLMSGGADGTGTDDTEGTWQLLEDCEWRAIDHQWTIGAEGDETIISATISCARCYEDCEPLILGCCDDPVPRTLHGTLYGYVVPPVIPDEFNPTLDVAYDFTLTYTPGGLAGDEVRWKTTITFDEESAEIVVSCGFTLGSVSTPNGVFVPSIDCDAIASNIANGFPGTYSTGVTPARCCDPFVWMFTYGAFALGYLNTPVLYNGQLVDWRVGIVTE